MIWILRIIGSLLLVVTLLPLLPSGEWLVRIWDFPRLQIAILLAVAWVGAVVALIKSQTQREHWGWAILLFAALVWQSSHVIRFTPLWFTEVPAVSTAEKQTIKLMVVNLKVENGNYQMVEKDILNHSPDLLLLVENDSRWQQGLSRLRDEYSYHREVVRGEGLGLALWSRIKFSDAKIRYLVSERRASIWATLDWEGQAQVNFVGVHPTPPGLQDSTGDARRDSRVRDAELILVASEIADRSDEHWIVAGDFNDVAWSHTTRLFKRTSGLLDPRAGRSFLGTYHAKYPIVRFPIDHVFVSDGFAISELSRAKISGSDHFAMVTQIRLVSPSDGTTPRPENNDRAEAAELVEEGKEDAEERGIGDE